MPTQVYIRICKSIDLESAMMRFAVLVLKRTALCNYSTVRQVGNTNRVAAEVAEAVGAFHHHLSL